jgi:hypothetical protein
MARAGETRIMGCALGWATVQMHQEGKIAVDCLLADLQISRQERRGRLLGRDWSAQCRHWDVQTNPEWLTVLGPGQGCGEGRDGGERKE